MRSLILDVVRIVDCTNFVHLLISQNINGTLRKNGDVTGNMTARADEICKPKLGKKILTAPEISCMKSPRCA